ncbi:L,D-transpeptidase [Candidatus Methylospira mobilis]|uniref:L,D-transpeptidase n=1 Tax=Candidatus Methylospira mobilis TaxID=1808979 RepID=A0A5Q0BLP8_9GAMM|nr:L,D-transpeptidase [Candidatus Methylospira mobilis]QFY44855.1 L,D-transpeptidase [Candidatus Methylospira mobilis]WNV05601.1 L,D-transpeptidase [Candidatus Methylospira mobilis]
MNISAEPHLRVSIADQRLTLLSAEGDALGSWPVSTARNGPGERLGSGCTPRGRHAIRACIGGDRPGNAVFVGRRWTGEIYSSELAERFPERDWILTRILWLSGLEPGFNRYGETSTGRRYIYIHGSPDEGVDGTPASHGCIRMKTADILELYPRVRAGIQVSIE